MLPFPKGGKMLKKYLLYKEFAEILAELKALCETKKDIATIVMSSIPRFAHIPDMNWPVEKEYFLKLAFEPIWRKCDAPEDIYSWIAEKRLGVGVFWTNDEVWDWLRECDDYVTKDDAAVLFKNVKTFLNKKVAA